MLAVRAISQSYLAAADADGWSGAGSINEGKAPMRHLFQQLLRFLRCRRRPARKIEAFDASARDPVDPAPTRARGRPVDAAAYRAALASLPAKRRELLQLHQIDGMSFIEIAEMMGISVAHVERDIAAALGHLAVRLEAEGDAPPGPPSD